MRAVAVLIGVVAFAITGAAAASHREAAVTSRSASFPSWSPDGRQILFRSGDRIVRGSSRPGGAIRTIVGPSYTKPINEPLLWARGGRIVFSDVGPDTWYSVGLDGRKRKRITFPSNYPQNFIVSPNREYVAVSLSDRGPGWIALLKLKPGRNPVVISTPLTAEEQNSPIGDDPVGFSPQRQTTGLLAPRRNRTSGPLGDPSQWRRPGALGAERDSRRVTGAERCSICAVVSRRPLGRLRREPDTRSRTNHPRKRTTPPAALPGS